MVKLAVRIVLFVAILTMAVAPAAAQEPQYKFPAQGQPYAGTTINVALVAETRSDAIKEFLPEFEKQTGIKVSLNILPYANLQEKQFTAVSQQQGAYDVVHVDLVWMGQYAGQGWLHPVTDFVKQTDPKVLQLEDFHPKVLEQQCMWKGVLYGLPFINAVHAMFYRPDILKKYNLEVPRTWDELYDTAKTITEKESANGIYGVNVSAQRSENLICSYTGMLGAFGGNWYDDKYNSTLNSPEAIAALDYFLKLEEVAIPGITAAHYDETAQAFADGKVAMSLQWQNAAPWFQDPKKSKIVGQWDIAVTPGVKQADGTIKATPVLGGWDMGITTDSKNKEAAWEFLVWATTQDMERKLATAMPSSRVSILTDPTFAAEHLEYPLMVKAWDVAMGRPRIKEWPQMAELLQTALSDALTGAKTPKDALEQINPLIDEILATSYRQ